MPIGFWPEKRKSRATVKVAESGFALPRTSPIHDLIENGGEEEIRTLDPHVANVMLYQLSYFPFAKNGAKYIKSRTQKQEACDYFFGSRSQSTEERPF